jgi:hypothetical protein
MVVQVAQKSITLDCKISVFSDDVKLKPIYLNDNILGQLVSRKSPGHFAIPSRSDFYTLLKENDGSYNIICSIRGLDTHITTIGISSLHDLQNALKFIFGNEIEMKKIENAVRTSQNMGWL